MASRHLAAKSISWSMSVVVNLAALSRRLTVVFVLMSVHVFVSLSAVTVTPCVGPVAGRGGL